MLHKIKTENEEPNRKKLKESINNETYLLVYEIAKEWYDFANSYWIEVLPNA